MQILRFAQDDRSLYTCESYLAGIGIRSSLRVGLTGGDDIWGEVMLGLAQGVTKIGLDYVTEALDLNPLLANIGFSAIATLLQAGIQAGMPNGEKNIFKTVFEIYKNNTLTFLGYGDPSNPNYAWQQAAYISQILDFSDIIRDQGLVEALNIYAMGFFSFVVLSNLHAPIRIFIRCKSIFFQPRGFSDLNFIHSVFIYNK